jgi:hypothetical protein
VEEALQARDAPMSDRRPVHELSNTEIVEEARKHMQPTQGRRTEWPEGLLAPGEYAKGPDGAWYAMTPNGHLAGLALHDVVEHEDGTITVSPSISVRQERAELWHGYLERGQWRSV